MAVLTKRVVECNEVVDFGEKFGVFGFEIRFIQQFDGGSGGLESYGARLWLGLGKLGGEGR